MLINTQTGDDTAHPPNWPADPLKASDDLEVELTRDERLIIELHERPKKELIRRRERLWRKRLRMSGERY